MAVTVPTISHSLHADVIRAAAGMGYGLPENAGRGSRMLERRVPLDRLVGLLAELRRQSADEAIGLRVGRLLGPAAFGIAGYLAMAGPTLVEAMPRIIGYQRLVADGMALRCGVDERTVHFDLEFRIGAVPRELSDLLMAGVRCFGAWLLGCEPPLDRVRFRYSRPVDTRIHEEVFGCMPVFDAAVDGFELDRRWIETPLRTAEASLAPLLEAQAARLLAAFRGDTFTAAVSQVLVELLPGGEVTIDGVADAMHASPRTLQRRLRAHGLTFNRLLQQVRIELANRYLSDDALSLQDIAGRLGYREQSSFCHAYRQWTGRAPSAARRCQESLVT